MMWGSGGQPVSHRMWGSVPCVTWPSLGVRPPIWCGAEAVPPGWFGAGVRPCHAVWCGVCPPVWCEAGASVSRGMESLWEPGLGENHADTVTFARELQLRVWNRDGGENKVVG